MDSPSLGLEPAASIEARDRVYGPNLTLLVCRRAAEERLPIYIYGSRAEILTALTTNLIRRFPGLQVAGFQPSKYRQITAGEKRQVIEQIRGSGAKIVLLGLGCPRQETWAYEYREASRCRSSRSGRHSTSTPVGSVRPPELLQRYGLEWAFRLSVEPRRLWRRYLLLNPSYLLLVLCQLTSIVKFSGSIAASPWTRRIMGRIFKYFNIFCSCWGIVKATSTTVPSVGGADRETVRGAAIPGQGPQGRRRPGDDISAANFVTTVLLARGLSQASAASRRRTRSSVQIQGLPDLVWRHQRAHVTCPHRTTEG